MDDDITDIAIGKLSGDDNEDVVAIDTYPINDTLNVLYGEDGSCYWDDEYDGMSVAVGDIALPPIAIPPVKSKLHSLLPQEQVVGNRASYVVGCDYTPVSIVQSRLSLLSVS